MQSELQERPAGASETIGDFKAKISQAKMERAEWVETSPEIIQYFNRNGLNGAKFFIYEGIKVAPFGQADSIEEENHEQLGQRIHGTTEALVDNRT